MPVPDTHPPAAPPRHRPPPVVLVAAALTALRSVVGAGGLVYFGVIATDVNPAAGTPAAIGFTAVGLLLTVLALGALPGLWRGRRTSWHVLTCCVSADLYFGSYKLLVEGEVDSAVFVVIDLVVGALLLAPAARRYVGAAS